MYSDFIDSPKVAKDDRELVLAPIDEKKTKSSTGLVDPRLFTGENTLHIIRGGNNIWSLKYSKGGLPPALMGQKFTTFVNAYKFVEEYFLKRNIKIVEVRD